MIAYIRGKLVQKNTDSVVVDCMGIGYEVFTSLGVINEAEIEDDEILLHTYLKISEDSHSLYGFLERDDLNLFKKLIGVNGVGPKAALSIMSTLKGISLKVAIITEDYKTISQAPGVGVKIAKRIILDLKDKMDPGIGDINTADEGKAGEGVQKEVLEALMALGYSNAQSLKAIKNIQINEGDTTENVLKQALKKLAIF